MTHVYVNVDTLAVPARRLHTGDVYRTRSPGRVSRLGYHRRNGRNRDSSFRWPVPRPLARAGVRQPVSVCPRVIADLNPFAGYVRWTELSPPLIGSSCSHLLVGNGDVILLVWVVLFLGSARTHTFSEDAVSDDAASCVRAAPREGVHLYPVYQARYIGRHHIVVAVSSRDGVSP